MRSKQEILGIVEDYAKSGMTRREYCEKHKLSITTLDYWRRGQKSKPKLVEHTQVSYPVGHMTTMAWIGVRPGDVHLAIS